MTNPYYNGPSGITPFTRARAEDITANFMAIASGFDLMQTGGSAESPQYSGTVTAGAFTTTGIMTAGSGIFTNASFNGTAFFGDNRFFKAIQAAAPTDQYDTGDLMKYDRSADAFLWQIGSVTKLQLSSTSANFGVALQQGGQQVWHAGNLTPSNYAALTGANYSGAVRVGTTGSSGYITLVPGDTVNSGQVQWYGGAGNRLNFVYSPTAGLGAGSLVFGSDNGNGYTFTGGIVRFVGPSSTQSGQIDFRNNSGTRQAGAYVPGTGARPNDLHFYNDAGGGIYSEATIGAAGAITAGDTISTTGSVTAGDANTFLSGTGTPQIQLGAGFAVRQQFGRLIFLVGGTAVFSIDGNGNTLQKGSAGWNQGGV